MAFVEPFVAAHHKPCRWYGPDLMLPNEAGTVAIGIPHGMFGKVVWFVNVGLVRCPNVRFLNGYERVLTDEDRFSLVPAEELEPYDPDGKPVAALDYYSWKMLGVGLGDWVTTDG